MLLQVNRKIRLALPTLDLINHNDLKGGYVYFTIFWLYLHCTAVTKAMTEMHSDTCKLR